MILRRLLIVVAALGAGYVPPASAVSTNLVFVPVKPPCRVIDTRIAGGKFHPPPAVRGYILRGKASYSDYGGSPSGCGVPAETGGFNVAKAVSVNVVAVESEGPGHWLSWPGDGSEPLASILNYNQMSPPLNIANGVLLPLRDAVGGAADVDLYFRASTSASHLVVDITGYFTEATGPLSVRGVNWSSHEVVLESRTGAIAGAALRWNSTPATSGRSYSLISTASGSAAGVGKFALWDNTAGAYRLLVEADGDVVIGTTSASSSRLLVSAPGNNGIAIAGNDTGDTRLEINNGGGFHYLFDDDSEGHDLKLESAAGTDLVLNTGGPNERLRILAEGSVCINQPGEADCQSSDLAIKASSLGGNAFQIRNPSGTETLYMTGAGRIVANTLNLADVSGAGGVGHLCHTIGGNVVACSSSAEYVPADQTGSQRPEAGDLVMIVPGRANPWQDEHVPFVVAKSERACDPHLMGFLTDPAMGASGKRLNEHYLPLAIYGYFPLKVTAEGGPIRRGDPITSSSTPGKGMRSTGACRIVGYALEDADRDGTIQVFAWSGESAAPHVQRLELEVEALRERNRSLEATLAGLSRKIDVLLAAGARPAPAPTAPGAASERPHRRPRR